MAKRLGVALLVLAAVLLIASCDARELKAEKDRAGAGAGIGTASAGGTGGVREVKAPVSLPLLPPGLQVPNVPLAPPGLVPNLPLPNLPLPPVVGPGQPPSRDSTTKSP